MLKIKAKTIIAPAISTTLPFAGLVVTLGGVVVVTGPAGTVMGAVVVVGTVVLHTKLPESVPATTRQPSGTVVTVVNEGEQSLLW